MRTDLLSFGPWNMLYNPILDRTLKMELSTIRTELFESHQIARMFLKTDVI